MKVLDIYQTDPVGFVKMFFPKIDELEKWQTDFLNHLAEGVKRNDDKPVLTAIKAGKGVGKTMVICLSMLWVMCCFDAPCIRVMASTQMQTINVVMREAKFLIENSLLKDCIVCKQLSIHLRDGSKPSMLQSIRAQVAPKDSPDKVAGDHSDFNFYVIDEASTLSDENLNSILGIGATGKTFVTLIGNPMSKQGAFYKITTGAESYVDKGWTVKTVSGYDMKRKGFNIKSLEQIYGGKDNDLNKMYIQGQWIDTQEGIYFPTEIVREAIYDRCYIPDHLVDNIVIGIDVATGTMRDFTCIFARSRNLAKLLLYSNEISTTQLIDFIIDYYYRTKCKIVMDCSGSGKMLLNNLHGSNVYPVELYTASQSTRPSYFANRKSELFFRTGEWLKNSEPRIVFDTTQQEEQFQSEMRTLPFRYKNDRLDIGNKNSMKKSPDMADALSYTFYYFEDNRRAELEPIVLGHRTRGVRRF